MYASHWSIIQIQFNITTTFPLHLLLGYSNFHESWRSSWITEGLRNCVESNFYFRSTAVDFFSPRSVRISWLQKPLSSWSDTTKSILYFSINFTGNRPRKIENFRPKKLFRYSMFFFSPIIRNRMSFTEKFSTPRGSWFETIFGTKSTGKSLGPLHRNRTVAHIFHNSHQKGRKVIVTAAPESFPAKCYLTFSVNGFSRELWLSVPNVYAISPV